MKARAASSGAASTRAALWVILAGVTAALHIGKLPPALPLLREALGVTLLQSGFLLSLVQLAGMTLGLAVGLLADGFGLKRSMLTGLLLLAVASALGGLASSAGGMLAWRALEGMGLLLVVLPAPGLVRQLVPPAQLNRMMGLWGAYMPLGTALALAVGALLMQGIGWRAWWGLLAALSLGMAAVLWRSVRPDPQAGGAAAAAAPADWRQRLRQTLGSRGPWLLAACFCMYSGQWLAVVGFLPTVYAEAGVAAGLAGALTALVAAANMSGNIVSGLLLQRGVAPRSLLFTGFLAMGASTVLAYARVAGLSAGPWLQLACVLVFSAVGGLIPGTLFALAVRLAPTPQTVSTTVGWMQQLSGLGQVCGPPLVAWVAAGAGHWHRTWWVTLGCSLLGLLLAGSLGRILKNSTPERP